MHVADVVAFQVEEGEDMRLAGILGCIDTLLMARRASFRAVFTCEA